MLARTTAVVLVAALSGTSAPEIPGWSAGEIPASAKAAPPAARDPEKNVTTSESAPDAAPGETLETDLEVRARESVSASNLDAVDPETVVERQPPPPGELREVFWVTVEAGLPEVVGSSFGVGSRRLLALNPELKPDQVIPAGTRVRVFAYDAAQPTQSVGAPNRGRLKHGIPLPEGPYWNLRDNRRRTFGTHLAITSLLAAFREFGQKHPEGPKIRVGELSRRRGGRIRPHNSHRTGRDIDLGYLHTSEPEDKKWVRTTSKNFDLQRNWELVEAILNTGNVQSIYMSARVQRRLYKHAKASGVPQALLDTYFQHPRRPGSELAVIRHSRGHHNHFHVRFRCEDWNRRCRARSRSRKPRRS